MSAGAFSRNITLPLVGLNGSSVVSTMNVPMWGIQALATTIFPCVSVPVLSEQMSVTDPRLSSAFIFLTMTFRAFIDHVPLAMVMVRTTINDAGIMARPVATA